ncbi:MAG: hypothetical protein WCB68_01640 [Pyrinomonadaceae bacterium]
MSTSPQSNFAPKELQTRFLYPFTLGRKEKQESQDGADATIAADAHQALTAMSLTTREGEPMPVWEKDAVPHPLYQEELLGHIVKFLFDEADQQKPSYKYLRLHGPTANRWFNGLEVQLTEQKKFRLGLATNALIEIFLTDYGAGVLSIALCPDVSSLDLNDAKLFNYKLSQLRKGTAPTLHRPHPTEASNLSAERIEALRQKVPMPDGSEPLLKRLGKPGASFALKELIDELLLNPLAALNITPCQNQLSIYTVARFDSSVDFEKRAVRDALATFLSGMAQVEEPDHAGSLTGTVSVRNEVLNRCHWAGIGLLGAAHLISDQSPPEHSFNAQRMSRLLLKYFMPHLVALLQRTTLNFISSDATKLVRHSQREIAKKPVELRHDLLKFAVEGYFTEVSTREVIQLYYRMTQKSLGVRNILDHVRRAVSDIEAKQRADRNAQMADETRQALVKQVEQTRIMSESLNATKGVQEQMSVNLETMARIQEKVERIEIFIIIVYASELAHLVLEEFEKEHHIWHPAIIAIMFGLAFTALLMLILKLWDKKKEKREEG